jgi:hypothetical protein
VTEIIVLHRDTDESSPTFNDVQWNGVSLGAPGSDDSAVQLAELPMDEVCGGPVTTTSGEMTCDVGGVTYEVLPAILHDTRKFVFVGRRVGVTPEAPEVQP